MLRINVVSFGNLCLVNAVSLDAATTRRNTVEKHQTLLRSCYNISFVANVSPILKIDFSWPSDYLQSRFHTVVISDRPGFFQFFRCSYSNRASRTFDVTLVCMDTTKFNKPLITFKLTTPMVFMKLFLHISYYLSPQKLLLNMHTKPNFFHTRQNSPKSLFWFTAKRRLIDAICSEFDSCQFTINRWKQKCGFSI